MRGVLHLLLAVVAAVFVVAAAPGQTTLAGVGWRLYANLFTRGGAGNGAGELLARFDADDVQGYGVEDAYPGMQVVRGVALLWRNFGSTNPDCDITVYLEDPATPGYPDLSNPLGGVTAVQPAGTGFNYQRFLFPAPVLVPPGRDLFVGVTVQPVTSTIGGVRLNYVPGTSGASSYDLAGPAMPTSPPEANSYRLFRDLGTNAMSYLGRGFYALDLLTSAPGGFVTARTNQVTYAVSNSVPGTTSMLSGLHPDAASPPLHAGRADEVGFLYSDPNAAPGMPVAFVGSFGRGPLVPLSTYVAGSVGGLCLDPAAYFVLGFGTLDAGHLAWLMTPLPPTVRAAIRGISWTQQAIGFDTSAGTLRGTQCVRQHF